MNSMLESIRALPMKSVVTTMICGYVVGLGATVLYHNYFARASAASINKPQWVFSAVMGLLSQVLCYSRGVRCTLALVLPIMFSTKGRSLMVAIAFLLAATGPTVNIVANVDELIKSVSCGQGKLKEAVGEMLDLIKQPVVAIKDAIENVMNETRVVMERVQGILVRIEELVIVILASIKNGFDWLHSIVNVCNHEFGTPFERCMKMGQDAMDDCRARMGPMNGLCQVTHIFKMFCYSVKFVDLICLMVDTVPDDFILVAYKALKKFADDVKTMFDVTVTFKHDFYFKTVASQDVENVTAEVMEEIHHRMRPLKIVFGWLDVIGSFLVFSVLLKAVYFRMRYLNDKQFNNKYVTVDFVALDLRRKKEQLETVLPLTSSERRKFVELTGYRLTKSEVSKIARSILFLTITCIQLFCVCFTDYSLYWMLALISYYGHQQAGIEVPPYIKFEIEDGESIIGDIVLGIVHAFEPSTQNYTFDTRTCLPHPKEPDYNSYMHIGGMCIAAWVFLFFQPYGLRMRHVVMRLFYPKVALARTEWLYEHILLKRETFFRMARRKARAKFQGNSSREVFAWMDWLRAKTEHCWICRCLFGRRTGSHCIICTKSVKSDRVVCPNCNAVFCENCWHDSSDLCCVCSKPKDYGDISETSEVVDEFSDYSELALDDETAKLCGETPRKGD